MSNDAVVLPEDDPEDLLRIFRHLVEAGGRAPDDQGEPAPGRPAP